MDTITGGSDMEKAIKTKIGYKLLASDMHSRTTKYERLYYPETGEWVHGDIYVGKDVDGAQAYLNGSLDAHWLVTVEYVFAKRRSMHIDIASAVRVIAVERWHGYDVWITEHALDNIDQRPSGLRTALRKITQAGWSIPVELTAGWDAPKIEGDAHSWETPAGDPVRYPSAYRNAFGRPVYVPSSQRIVVGADWLLDKGICPDAVYYC